MQKSNIPLRADEQTVVNNDNHSQGNKVVPILNEQYKQEAWTIHNKFQDDCEQDLSKVSPYNTLYNQVNTKTAKYYKNKSQWTIPYLIIILSLIQIAIYTLGGDSIRDLFIFIPERSQEVWRYVSYAFLHNGTLHLLLNIFIQCLVSIPLEGSQGRIRCMIVYFGGAILGALGTSLFQPNLRIVGASAAAYALLMSHLTDIVVNPYGSYRRGRFLAVLFLSLVDIVSYFVPLDAVTWLSNSTTSSNVRIGTEAHICGALSGIVISTAIYSSLPWHCCTKPNNS
ncbi:protein rhomboid-like isoform X2 [Ctenocephalides felis]|uniref:protein rhomboid-like isoform X2 n=1 Tax=Ctenocephalides felis TaxID=7515 RepID=UPI000E6E3B04|nr:protein rhomboid-like isoform X2 [Ctenocephalides felis]